MIERPANCELEAIKQCAYAMCAAARTAPKGKGVDRIETCVITGLEKDDIANEMERLSEPLGYPFFSRDSKNVRASGALVIIGASYGTRGLNDGCRYCLFENCADCIKKGGVCAHDLVDLGIAIGSAASIAADFRVDTRVMFSIGRAALALGLMPPEVKAAYGLPLSVSGKSPFFDRQQ